MTPHELDNLTFHVAELRSPTGGRYLVDDGDASLYGDEYLWLKPLDADGKPTGGRRRRLQFCEAADWKLWTEETQEAAAPATNPNTVHVELDTHASGTGPGGVSVTCREDEALNGRCTRGKDGRFCMNTYHGLVKWSRNRRGAIVRAAKELGYEHVEFSYAVRGAAA